MPIPVGIFKPAGDNLIIYDQLCQPVYDAVGAYGCSIIATLASASNLTGLQLTNSQLGEVCRNFVATGKFVPGFGAAAIDAAPFALAEFNRMTGLSLTGRFDALNTENAVNALAAGSGACFAVRVGPKYVPDGQDNALIDTPYEDKGNLGHFHSIIKINTTGTLVDCKYLDQYAGRVYNGQGFKNVVQFRLPDFLVACQSFLYVISK